MPGRKPPGRGAYCGGLGMRGGYEEYSRHSLPPNRLPSKAEDVENDLIRGRKDKERAEAELLAACQVLRWLLATYDFEAETVERIRSVLP